MHMHVHFTCACVYLSFLQSLCQIPGCLTGADGAIQLHMYTYMYMYIQYIYTSHQRIRTVLYQSVHTRDCVQTCACCRLNSSFLRSLSTSCTLLDDSENLA